MVCGLRSIWQLRTTWEDQIIGGRLTIKGRELQLTKSWPVPLGDRQDLAARLRFKLGVDLYSGRTYCRFGFNTYEVRQHHSRVIVCVSPIVLPA